MGTASVNEGRDRSAGLIEGDHAPTSAIIRILQFIMIGSILYKLGELIAMWFSYIYCTGWYSS